MNLHYDAISPCLKAWKSLLAKNISVRFWFEMNQFVLEENIFFHALYYVLINLKLNNFNFFLSREICAVFVQKRFKCNFLPPPFEKKRHISLHMSVCHSVFYGVRIGSFAKA